MKELLDKNLRFDQTALNLRAYRQQLIASNIANADTPNYKAQDIEFRSTLDNLLGKREGQTPNLALAVTSERHVRIGEMAEPMDRFRKFRSEEQSSVDGNTVNMDVERAAFTENAIQYEASINFINGILSGMQRAISGQ